MAQSGGVLVPGMLMPMLSIAGYQTRQAPRALVRCL